jgi:hypothetical protein
MNQPPRQPTGSASRRSALNRRLRIAFIAGAEEDSRSTLGRGLTDEELRRVLRRYPGDVSERQRHGPSIVSPLASVSRGRAAVYSPAVLRLRDQSWASGERLLHGRCREAHRHEDRTAPAPTNVSAFASR